MTKTYLRPLGLLWGPDARRAVAAGIAGRLGGSEFIAYGMAEIAERNGETIRRQTISYAEAAEFEAIRRRIETPRGKLAGIGLERPRLMGIVNVTPDSFSDGGLNAEARQAIAHGRMLMQEGADILDVGGESTRPGARPIAIEEEWRRIEPVIEGLNRAGAVVSVDTRKAKVMERAAAAGAAAVNDVSALGHDPESLATAARLGLPVVLMHAQGPPETMQIDPRYEDVALDVFDALEARIEACIAAGMGRDKLVADPGIGFGKTSRHNVELLQQLPLFHGLGLPLLIGLSRKGFTGHLTGEKEPRHRVHGSVAGAVHAMMMGAQIIRVHDVKATKQARAVTLAACDPEMSGL
jgi:dihydropteroate synthase